MTEPTPAPAQEPQQTPQQPVETPPWGEDFDPARAWHTIQSLREREKELSRQPRLSDEQQRQLTEYNQLVEASKSEAQRQQEALTAAQRAAETARSEADRYRAAATYGITADHFDLLGSGSYEEIAARAEKLSGLLRKDEIPAPPTLPSAPQRRPVEQLRPGATPSGAESESDRVYAALFGSNTP